MTVCGVNASVIFKPRKRPLTAISVRVATQEPDGRIEFSLPLAIATELCGHAQTFRSLALLSRLPRARWQAPWKAHSLKYARPASRCGSVLLKVCVFVLRRLTKNATSKHPAVAWCKFGPRKVLGRQHIFHASPLKTTHNGAAWMGSHLRTGEYPRLIRCLV
jgi:hypothetical protein